MQRPWRPSGSLSTRIILPWLLGVVVTWTKPARAQVHELRWDPSVDAPVTVLSTAFFVTSVALESALAPSKCRWCQRNALDDRVRASLAWSDVHLPDEASNVTGFVLAPMSTLGFDLLAASHDHAARGAGVDALVIMEATMIALDIDSVTKLLVARQRPHASSPPGDASGQRPYSPEDNLSFFSGHTAGAFALAAATGTVATMRGYRWAPVPWLCGGALAAGTGYLRVAADRHWLTDVIVGMVVGIAIGVAVPRLLHPPTGASE